MKGSKGRVVFEGKVQVGDVPVVVAPVNEEVRFGACVGVCGAVEEVALAVGFFADVVTRSVITLATGHPISILQLP